jgi:hypothetical protein
MIHWAIACETLIVLYSWALLALNVVSEDRYAWVGLYLCIENIAAWISAIVHTWG